MLVTVTVTPGSTPPSLSLMVPRRTAVNPCASLRAAAAVVSARIVNAVISWRIARLLRLLQLCGRLRAVERRAARVPVGRGLVRVADAKERRLVKRLRVELNAQRQTRIVVREATRDHDRRQARHVAQKRIA